MDKPVWTLLLGIIIGAALMLATVSMVKPRENAEAEFREISSGLQIYQVYAETAKNHEAMAMLALDGLVDSRIDETPEAVIEHLEELIEQTTNPAIRRSLRFRLGEIYFDHDQLEQAIEQMEQVVLESDTRADKSEPDE